jgi:hypothetical protein
MYKGLFMQRSIYLLLFTFIFSSILFACGDDTVDTSSTGDSGECANTICGESCVDTLSDANNCGACANVCGSGNLCVNG